MPIEFSIDYEQQRLTVVATGDITYNDVVAHIEEERQQSGLSLPELIDARGCRPHLTPAHVRSVVAWLRRLGEDAPLGPTAVVVDSDVAFGVMRMFEIMLDDVCEVRPFRDVVAADLWLRSHSSR